MARSFFSDGVAMVRISGLVDDVIHAHNGQAKKSLTRDSYGTKYDVFMPHCQLVNKNSYCCQTITQTVHLMLGWDSFELEIRSMERGICPIAMLALHLTLYSLTGSRFDPRVT